MKKDIRLGTFSLDLSEDGALAILNRLSESVGPRTELVITFFEDGRFGYYCSGKKSISDLAKQFGWLLADTRTDSSGITTGEGYYPTQRFTACFWQCPSFERSREIEHILVNTWAPLSYDGNYFPDNVPFHHFTKDGFNCYYLYDYYRKDTKHQRTDHEKRARNLIFQMKDGRASHDAARRLAFAMNNQFPEDMRTKNHLILPIHASDPVKSHKRYFEFCKLLSWYTGIPNGYDAVKMNDYKWESNVKTNINLHHLDFDRNKLIGKYIYLIDDIYTTGTSFSAMVEELGLIKELVIGVFLGKTSAE